MRYIIGIIVAGFIFGGSYALNFLECKDDLYVQINDAFQWEASNWGDSIMRIKGLPHWGAFDLLEYAKKEQTSIISETDTIEISSRFYHPELYREYQKKNTETALVLAEEYALVVTDSLFRNMLERKGLHGLSSTELQIRDLHQLFPSVDSMCTDAPYTNKLGGGNVMGYTTGPVSVGICSHALLFGHVQISFWEILSQMDRWGLYQSLVFILILLLTWLEYLRVKYLPLLRMYKSHLKLLGNTCLDLNRNQVYLWDGTCKPIIGNKVTLIKMLVDASPSYKLLKEDICRTLWKRDTKDGQALYNMAVSDVRGLFVSSDPSLTLKSLPKEGVQLLIDSSLVHKWRWMHFLPVLIRVNLGEGKAGDKKGDNMQ